MIQAIGFLLCVYLFVKALELIAMQKAGGIAPILAYIGAGIAILAALFFFYVLSQSSISTDPANLDNYGDQSEPGSLTGPNGLAPSAPTAPYTKCLQDAFTNDELEKCKRLQR